MTRDDSSPTIRTHLLRLIESVRGELHYLFLIDVCLVIGLIEKRPYPLTLYLLYPLKILILLLEDFSKQLRHDKRVKQKR